MLHAKPKHLPGLIPKASRPKRAISCGRPACAIATRTFELTVPWSAGPVEAGLAVAIAQEDDAPVEFVTLRVDAADVFPTPQLPELPPGGKSRRRDRRLPADIVRWGWIEAPIYDRARLGAGDHIDGPAIITQLDATTLLLLGQTAEIHPLGSLVVHDRSRGIGSRSCCLSVAAVSSGSDLTPSNPSRNLGHETRYRWFESISLHKIADYISMLDRSV